MRTHPTQNQPETYQMYRHTDDKQRNHLVSIYHPVWFPLNSPVQNIPRLKWRIWVYYISQTIV